MRSKHMRAHGKPAGTKNIRPGKKIHVPLHKDTHMSEDTMARHMKGLSGEHREIYANPYKSSAQQRRERRLTNKPL